jgi:hypothetical protein
VWLVLCSGVEVVPAASAEGPACRPAELIASDNTADDLGLFEIQADITLTLNDTAVTGSTLIDGVFWSDQLQQTISEQSREFHLCALDEPALHTAAAALRSQFSQEAVLTFDYLPQHEANAVIITVPDIDIARFRDAFVADSAARHRLLGGSVTTTDHALILIAGTGDLHIARRLVGEAGGNWEAATIAHGTRELVT